MELGTADFILCVGFIHVPSKYVSTRNWTIKQKLRRRKIARQPIIMWIFISKRTFLTTCGIISEFFFTKICHTPNDRCLRTYDNVESTKMNMKNFITHPNEFLICEKISESLPKLYTHSVFDKNDNWGSVAWNFKP